MSDTERTIEQRVFSLEQQLRRGKWVSALECDLRKSAISYANLVKFNTSIETDGTRVVHCMRDAEELAEYETKKMQRIAVQLLRELAIEENP